MIEIKRINLETSLVCNTKCRFCPRTVMKNRGISFPKKHLDLDKFFALDFQNINLKEVIICGSFGEPIFHPEFFRLINFFEDNNIDIILHTNGSIHSIDWWKYLARTKNCNVHFMLEGIDEKTHKPYRQTSFETVTKNIKAFTNAGGIATASMLVFKHNEHCIKQYKDFVFNVLGCQYVHIKSSRMYDNVLQKPKNIEVKSRSEYSKENIPIRCLVRDIGEIMIDVDVNLYICCYMYNDNIMNHTNWKLSKTFTDLKTNILGRFTGQLPLCKLKCKGIQESFIEKLSYDDFMRQKIEKTRN